MKKLIVLLAVLMVLCGCSEKKPKDLANLKIGVMPSYDSTPILWAKDQGIFEEMGLDVEINVYSNGNDRDTQIQTGAVDAVVSDIMGLVSLIEANIEVQALSKTDTVFSVVSAKNAMSNTDLSLGMAEISVTQYAVDQGLTEKNIDKKFIDAIPQRLEMVAQQLIDGAILPEPMASMSKLKGLDSTPINIESPNILMFTKKAVEDKEASIKVFYEAYNKGIDSLNKNQDEVKDVVIKYLNLNAEIKDVLVLPEFTKATSVKEETYNNVLSWMSKTLDIKSEVEYSKAVSDIVK